jgi:hypothetical protein
MNYVLACKVANKHLYVQNAPVRAWDKKKLINTTDNIERAKPFYSEVEAQNFLSLCVTNGRKFKVEEKQSVLTQ